MIFPDVASTVGRTPLVLLKRITAGLNARVAVKLECRNPGASVKDRVGLAMVEAAEKSGALKAGGTIIEATSGNTGIALAMISAARGYRLILTMPERMSKERVSLLKHLGAEVVLTPGTLMKPAVDRARELQREISGAIVLEQFSNPANPEAHRVSTAIELWDDTDGKIDAFVAGVGTGGTITGVGEVLKARRPGVRIVAVEPAKCAVLSGQPPGHHLIQGMGAGFIPAILNRAVIDEVIAVSEDDSFRYARRLAKEEGIAAGISSGAALTAALQLAGRPEFAGKLIVALLPDSSERYVTTPLVDALLS